MSEPLSREEFLAVMGAHVTRLETIKDHLSYQDGRIGKIEDRTSLIETCVHKIITEHEVQGKVGNRLWGLVMALLLPTIAAVGAIIAHVFWK